MPVYRVSGVGPLKSTILIELPRTILIELDAKLLKKLILHALRVFT